MSHLKFVNPEHLSEDSKKAFSVSFTDAKPYKHLVIDGFLKTDIAQKIYDNFPAYEIFNKKYDGLNERKAEGSNFEDFDPMFSELKKEISSQEFCDWIESVTGVQKSFVTDDAMGAGLHQGKNGSFLDIHIDYSMHHIQHVYRRLNLLIFFNPNWKDEWNGHTELWNENMTVCDKKVRPDFNRCVIFETTGNSYHGYGKINPPEEVTRKSFYTYFYTHENVSHKEGYHDTIFKARPDDSTAKKIQTDVKEGLKNFLKKQFVRFGIKF